MASRDARSTTIEDFGVDPAAAGDHSPELHPRERVVRCRDCGVAVEHAVVAETPIRRALEELAAVSCARREPPDVSAGDHLPTTTGKHPDAPRTVACQSCGRQATVDDEERALRALSRIPCVDALSHVELVELLLSPTLFTPPLADLGITNWTATDGRRRGEGVERLFRHGRFRGTLSLRRADDGYAAAMGAGGETVAELRLPSADADHPVVRETAVTLVTFLSATDPLSAGEFERLRGAYERRREAAVESWLETAYERAETRFDERFDDTPAGFVDAFDGATDDVEEVLRRLVGSGGFGDPGEHAFAAELLGHDHGFPGFFRFVADRHSWSPPVPEG